jgi:hypothetical protein
MVSANHRILLAIVVALMWFGRKVLWGVASLNKLANHLKHARHRHVAGLPVSFRIDIQLSDSSRHSQATTAVAPPRNAEFLFYLFMTPQNCDAFVGDQEERYKLIHKRFGSRRANFWYWTQTVTSLGPIVWAWAKKVVMKPLVAIAAWAVAKGLVGYDSWLAALADLWKRIRS